MSATTSTSRARSSPCSSGQLGNFATFEFIRLVAGTPGRGLVPPAPPAFFPGWVLQRLLLRDRGGRRLERRAGGPVVQNLTHTYTLTPAERAYLMSARPRRRPAARCHEREAEHLGTALVEELRRALRRVQWTDKSPVLTLHTRIDGLVPVSHESAYAETVAGAGRSDLLAQAYTVGVGHCSLSPDQQVAAVDRPRQMGRERCQADGGRLPGGTGLRHRLRASGLAPAVATSCAGPASAGPPAGSPSG